VDARPARTVMMGTALAVLVGLLAACAPYPPFQLQPAPPVAAGPGDLATARAACDQQFPQRIGNYLAHARCVNTAVDRFVLPTTRYPDLIGMQQKMRMSLSARIDRRTISEQAASARMDQADALVAQVHRERDAGDQTAAARDQAALNALVLRR